MHWINIEEKLPKEFQPVLLTDLDVYWVGIYQICETLEKQKVLVWWASNPNEITLGHKPFLAHKPKYWCKILQPERLNPEDVDSAWIKWEFLKPPKDVKGIFIKFDNDQIWTDAHYYGSDEYRKKTVGDALPVSWTFMERGNSNHSIQCDVCDSPNSGNK